jgi:hypothetical protein
MFNWTLDLINDQRNDPINDPKKDPINEKVYYL